jgi:hypothetical protein
MVERDAYIDLVFRNGLKDMEVLPPSGVWEEIEPAIRKGKSLLFVRIAAGIAALLSLGIMAMFLSKQFESKQADQDIIISQDVRPFTDNYSEKTVPLQAILSDETAEDQIISQRDISDVAYYLNYKPIAPGVLIADERYDVYSLAGDYEIKDSGVAVNPLLASSGFKVIDPSGLYNLVPVEEKKVKKWMLGALAAPTYYLRYNPDKVNLTTRLQNSEVNNITYSGGVSFSYSINKKISLQSGLYYSSMGNMVNGVDTYSGFSNYINTKSSSNFGIATSNGMIVATNNDIYLSDNTGDRISTPYTADVFDPAKTSLQYINGSIHQSFQYLEVPVIVRYKLLDKKIGINLLGGLSYNLLVGNSAYAIYEGKHVFIGKTDGINPLAFSSSVGLGMEYDLSEKFSFNLEPTLRYYLSTMGNRTDGKNHPYLLGVYSGLFYKF